MKKCAIFIITICSFLFCFLTLRGYSEDKLLFNLKLMANKSPQIVEKNLGKPTELKDGNFKGIKGKTFKVKRGKYKNGLIEITFIDNAAKYITISFLRGNINYTYPDDAWTIIGELGFDKNTTASFSNGFVTRWENLSGIYEISVFATSKKVDYLHILTDKKYE